MTEGKGSVTSITIEDVLSWASGRSASEKNEAIQADIRSPESRILMLLGDLEPVLDRLEQQHSEELDRWQMKHPGHFPDHFSMADHEAMMAARGAVVDVLDIKPRRQEAAEEHGSGPRSKGRG